MDKQVYEFISKQTQDPIVERRKCKRTWQDFPIFQWDIDLLEKLKIKIWEKTYPVTINDLCPKARKQYKLMFKNERNLYKTKCDLTWKPTISRIHPKMNFQVYTNEAWASDDWDYCNYWLEIDNKKTVFDYLDILVKSTPYQDLIWSFSNLQSNSVYTNYTADITDCYFAFDCNTIEKSCYVKRCSRSKDLFDCFRTNNSEICYECIDCKNMYKCFFCNSSTDCNNSYYLYNCHWCSDCIGCSNLINKQYYVFNKQVSKEEYQKNLNQLKKDYYSKNIVETFENILFNYPRKNLHIINADKSIWNYIFNSKNVFFSELVNDSENIRHCYEIGESQDCLDVCGYWHESFLLYNSAQVGRYSNHIYCSSTIGKWENLIYCIETKKSRNCFGCVNLKEKEYCIFNKQYSKEEYQEIVPKLIDDMKKDETWWKFLPTTCSPYPYNDTVAMEYFPIKPEQLTILEPEKIISDAILDLWWEEKIKIKRRTKNNNIDIPSWINLIEANKLNTLESEEEILKVAIICEISKKPFRIVWPELKFYKKYWLPLPLRHPDIRYQERLEKRPGSELYLRNCDKCSIEMLSVYPKDYQWKVYCEACYNREIYW